MNTTSVESLHGSLSRTRVVVLDEAVIQTFVMELGPTKRQQLSSAVGAVES